jgi:hypothetical protein
MTQNWLSDPPYPCSHTGKIQLDRRTSITVIT